MSLFKRGGKWWYEFSFCGQRIRESACTSSKTLAGEIERERRRGLEKSVGGVQRQKPILFSVAARAWLAASARWTDSTLEIYTLKMSHLLPEFGKLLVTKITAADIAAFQLKRRKSGASSREVNMETAVLRMVLRERRVWHQLEPDFHPLREAEGIGKALTPDEVHRLLTAAKQSRSQSLYPALVVLFNTGLRVSELRTMQWRQVDLLEHFLSVGRCKTKGGEGRVVPLNQDAYSALIQWRHDFRNPLPCHFVFPSERYGLDGENGYKHGTVAVWNRNPDKPIGSWKVAWRACRKLAGVECRLHDLRHTFISRLADGQTSDQTVMALAGHMSRKMMEWYSHARNEAKRLAVDSLNMRGIQGASPQFPPQQN